MSVAEETLNKQVVERAKPSVPVLNRVLDFLSAVRFGVVQLVALVLLSFVGMLIVQQNVNGFETFYLSLTPAEKTVYGWLGLFDVYNSWYFKFLLLTLSLNLVLASIDRFPSAWTYISEPKKSATRGWLLKQTQNAVLKIEGESEKEIAEKIKQIFEQNKLKTSITQENSTVYATDENGKKDFSKMESKTNLFVFGESGRFNRLGAYIVHVFLLTLFLGHFVALTTGFDADVRFMPGQTTNEIQLIEFNLDKQARYNVALPFTIHCTDIEQQLIDPKGNIGIGNTVDWRTQIKISDPEYGETVADVSLNKPFSYRGYRFFQASAITMGSARNMTLELKPEAGGESAKLNLARNGSANLADGTKIEYEAFFPDFAFVGGQPDTRSAEYNNPAVVLNVTPPGGETQRVFAFGGNVPENAPVSAPKAGYKWRLTDFEKSPLAHVLSIKYDPYDAAFIAWYIGGFGLLGALCFVFFISHRRVWALIEPVRTPSGSDVENSKFEIVLGANTNRNEQVLEDKFKKLVGDLGENFDADRA